MRKSQVSSTSVEAQLVFGVSTDAGVLSSHIFVVIVDMKRGVGETKSVGLGTLMRC